MTQREDGGWSWARGGRSDWALSSVGFSRRYPVVGTLRPQGVAAVLALIVLRAEAVMRRQALQRKGAEAE